MGRSANKPKRAGRDSASNAVLRNGTALVAQNPVLVGGSTAFLLTLFFVSANAVWYQPHGHPAAIFPTRALQYNAPGGAGSLLPDEMSAGPETVIRIERETIMAEPADPTVQKVQGILSDLNLYAGPVDGIAGPKTRDAIRNYRRILGLEPTDEIDALLIDQLGAKSPETTGSVAPVPVARPGDGNSKRETSAETSTPARGSLVVRIQAGLRAFGNDHIEIDGVSGPKTEQAIREFQSLFGLEVTGRADEILLQKMRDLGFVN